MSARITADAVTVFRDEKHPGDYRIISATVQGQRQIFVVDLNPAWGKQWFCTCGRAPGCAHIRATREVVSR